MKKTIIDSRAVWAVVAISAALFVLGSTMLDTATFITVLNSLFVGTSIAIGFAYWRLFMDAMFGEKDQPYKRVRQMTWGIFFLWMAVFLAAFGSIYTKSADLPNQTTVLLTASRFFAIIAAVLQVTAPDQGFELLHGRDRKFLALAIVIGLLASVALIFMQETEALALGLLGIV